MVSERVFPPLCLDVFWQVDVEGKRLRLAERITTLSIEVIQVQTLQEEHPK